ncbi:hypothetical protein [Rubripirellula reticaptiva]|nr:hypothetical protein [Rubripirellula reticaptiva]
MISNSKYSAAIAVAFACLAMTTGCTSIKLPASPFSHPAGELGDYTGLEGVPQMPESESERVYFAVKQAIANDSIILHVPGENPSTRILPLPTDGRSVYVSTLLEQTGVKKKMGFINATLYRHSSDSIAGIPLECRMNRDGSSIKAECDYSLQPGDRLTVRKGTNPAMQSIFNTMLGL